MEKINIKITLLTLLQFLIFSTIAQSEFTCYGESDSLNNRQGFWLCADTIIGVTIISYYEDDKLEGEYREISNKRFVLKEYKNNKLHNSSYVFVDGKLALEEVYSDGELKKRITYDSDGFLWTIENFKDNKLHGSYIYFLKKGKLDKIQDYDNGKSIFLTTFDKKGNIDKECGIEDGKLICD